MTEPICTKSFWEAVICKKGCQPCVISEGGKTVKIGKVNLKDE